MSSSRHATQISYTPSGAIGAMRQLWFQYKRAKANLARAERANFRDGAKANYSIEVDKHRFRLEYALGVGMSPEALRQAGSLRWVDPPISELRRLGTLG